MAFTIDGEKHLVDVIPTVSLDVISLEASSCGYYRGQIEQHVRNNSRGTGRHSEGARNVYHTAIRHAFSPWRPCGSSTADVHDCPRGVASLRHPLALKDTLGAHTGEAMTPSSHHATRCVAHPAIRFSPPGHGFPTLDARWKPWI